MGLVMDSQELFMGIQARVLLDIMSMEQKLAKAYS